MMTHRVVRAGSLFCLVQLVTAAHVAAAPLPRDTDVEIFGGASALSLLMKKTYDASYTPSRIGGLHQDFEAPDPRSRASQTISLNGDSGRGGAMGITVYPHRVLGVELLFDRSTSDLSGTNPPHTVDLVWDTIAFPAGGAIVARASLSYDVPETAARLKTTIWSLNGVARFNHGARVSGKASIGASYFRSRIEDLGVSALGGSLGGHAVLNLVLYEMSLTSDTANTVGINFGGSLDVSLGSRWAIFVDGRFFWAPLTKASAHLSSFVKEPVYDTPLDKIDRYLALRDIDVDARNVRLLVGLKWRP